MDGAPPRLFAGDLPVVDRILAATVGDVGSYSVYDLASVFVWQRDRGVLVGGDVHATSPSAGQGASLAVEDALTLAVCLRDEPDSGIRQRRPNAPPDHAHPGSPPQPKGEHHRGDGWRLRSPSPPIAARRP